ncbi:L domain-like protein [Hesseltinella vesiculosa]|uniref:L domain-like protein n=1 Tax=Hesseltinella vesiculosa TaxID=101127 RepID=A0A1X2GQB8_9FUNG|nr:L domain-like protein [Hesseltinella vesiculosa]
MLPNLLGGKLLTGVMPPDKHPSTPWLPVHTPILDIEACIDDPSLAPLGTHVRPVSLKKKKRRQPDSSSCSSVQSHKDTNGQVQIQPAHDMLLHNDQGAGLLMLRRCNLTAQQLAAQLHSMIPLGPLLHTIASDVNTCRRFDHLVELDISRNRLADIPLEVALLTHLRVLNASSNQITDLPSALYRHLTHLQVLNLSQNQLHTIPDELPDLLPFLVTLSLAGNRIDYLTPNVSHWQHLLHLQLGSVYGGNCLAWIPDTLVEMSRLQELDLSNNSITRLPTHMAMPSLLHLNVSKNQLGVLPSSIGQCHQLRTLNISKNHLTSLPVDLAQLANLELLDISENFVCIIPSDLLEQMKTTLLITGNPVTRPGHCDDGTQHPTDIYARILQRMSMRALPTVSPSISRYGSPAPPSDPLREASSPSIPEACGPYGRGCLPSSLPYPSPSTSSSFDAIPKEPPTQPSSTALLSPPKSPQLDPSVSSPRPDRRHRHHSRRHISHSPASLYGNDNDDSDARIDRELSFLAQRLRVNGSRRGQALTTSSSSSSLHDYATLPSSALSPSPSSVSSSSSTSPDTFAPTKFAEDDVLLSRSLLMDQTKAATEDGNDFSSDELMNMICTVVGESSEGSALEQQQPHTDILHSLRELATRVILQHDLQVPLHMIPPHLAKDLEAPRRHCTKCHLPFVNEWLTSVQVKSYRGHPAVVRRVRFCSTKCWQAYLHSRSSTMVCVHRPDTQTILRQSADQEESEWIQASMNASSSTSTSTSS